VLCEVDDKGGDRVLQFNNTFSPILPLTSTINRGFDHFLAAEFLASEIEISITSLISNNI